MAYRLHEIADYIGYLDTLYEHVFETLDRDRVHVVAYVVSNLMESIFSQSCDVFAPNAVGGTLNPDTISLIQAPVVCGAANNQLLDPERDDKTLDERGVLLVPDFLANRMGIVNCANEQYGVIDPDSVIDSHLDRDSEHGIFQRALNVFERSKASGLTTTHEAVALADELSDELHPIWGHRGQEIINHLVRSGWAEAEPVR